MSKFITIFFIALYVYTVLSTISVLLLENRNPAKSFSWMLIILFLPVIGLLLYMTFGQDLRKQKIISRKSLHNLPERVIAPFDITEVEELLNNLEKCQKNLIKLLYKNSEAIAYPANKVQVYSDGQNAFDAIFDAIRAAKNHIHIEFYILSNDKVAQQLKELLIQKSQEGVRVRMIYDYIGSLNLSRKYIKSLTKAGVYVRSFLPLRLRIFRSRINYRNHRKIMIIDGKIGFTGGMNIADRYIHGNRLGEWRDNFVRIEGAAVHGLQHLFLADWYFVERKLITDPKYYPQPENFNTNNLIQIVSSGPDTDRESIMQGMASAIMTASEYVYIQSPYYMPPELIECCIQIASLSGVDVRLMIPTRSDSIIAIKSTSSYLGKILEAGVKVYYYETGFLHSKTLVIDDMISIVGSCNIDYRSFTQNFEASAFIYEKETAIQLKELFMKDIQQCDEMTLEKWSNRSKFQKMEESFSRLFSPIL